MQMGGSMFLDEVAVTLPLFDKRFWFWRFGKITLGFIFSNLFILFAISSVRR